jgi:hypothetical protein
MIWFCVFITNIAWFQTLCLFPSILLPSCVSNSHQKFILHFVFVSTFYITILQVPENRPAIEAFLSLCKGVWVSLVQEWGSDKLVIRGHSNKGNLVGILMSMSPPCLEWGSADDQFLKSFYIHKRPILPLFTNTFSLGKVFQVDRIFLLFCRYQSPDCTDFSSDNEGEKLSQASDVIPS